MNLYRDIFFIIISYLIGSFPTGYLLAMSRGINIREVGSGNIGATNVTRTLGKGMGAITLLFDMLKGFLPPFTLLHYLGGSEVVVALSAISAFYGHIFSIFLKFKGGKGVATALGCLIAVNPVIGVGAIGVWLLIFIFVKISSVSALVSALYLILIGFFVDYPKTYEVMWIVFGGTIYVTHRDNIRRILKGEEK